MDWRVGVAVSLLAAWGSVLLVQGTRGRFEAEALRIPGALALALLGLGLLGLPVPPALSMILVLVGVVAALQRGKGSAEA